jgi:hypothetical protein
VDPSLRDELGLFPEIQGFEVARLFRSAVGEYVLEISYRDASGALAHERRRLTDVQLAALRADIQTRLAAQGRERVVERSGRAGLVLGQTVVGLGYHGWAAAEVLDLQDRGAVAAYLLVSGTSFLVPALITRTVPVSVSQRDAFFWGATRGIAFGIVSGFAIGGDEDPMDFEDDDERERLRLALGSAGSVAGSLFGFWAAGHYDAPPGTVALWSAAADFGLASAYGVSYALGLFDEELIFEGCPVTGPCIVRREGSNRDGYALTFGLGAAGLVGAKLWGDREDYTVGDARALRSFGLLGTQALLPVATGLFETSDTDDDAEHATAAMMVAGAWGGLFIGNRVLRRTSLSGGDGLLVLTGHVAGGLLALGLTYLVDDSEDIDDTVYLTTSAAGSMIGSLLTFNAVRSGQSAQQGTGPRAPERARGLASAQVTVHPEGVIAPLFGAGAGASSTRVVGSPLLTVRF